MANFYEAYNKTMKHEGGYSNDPVDFGGETYKGISRKYHPGWLGWKIVDSYKRRPDFPNNMKEDDDLNGAAKDFYKEMYWDRHLGDSMPSQNIAEEMFDNAVNMGVSRAAKFLQTGLNVLNRKEKHFP